MCCAGDKAGASWQRPAGASGLTYRSLSVPTRDTGGSDGTSSRCVKKGDGELQGSCKEKGLGQLHEPPRVFQRRRKKGEGGECGQSENDF